MTRITMPTPWRCCLTVLVVMTLFLVAGCDMGTYNQRLQESSGTNGNEEQSRFLPGLDVHAIQLTDSVLASAKKKALAGLTNAFESPGTRTVETIRVHS